MPTQEFPKVELRQKEELTLFIKNTKQTKYMSRIMEIVIPQKGYVGIGVEPKRAQLYFPYIIFSLLLHVFFFSIMQ